MLRIYNTLSGAKEPFEPIDPSMVRMYVCGPTTYAPAHIGHALSYIVFDVVKRYLLYKGYRVRHVQNFTDIDDRIIQRSQREGEQWDRLAARYAEEFLQDMELLNVLPADIYPRASGVIPGIIRDVGRLIQQGTAYEADGDVYFRVLSDPEYGKLSHRRLGEMRAGARVDPDERKEHPMDFALWKAAKPGEPAWESPWGPGRPGWHIECTTMNLETLGEQIDIHGGGHDLIFPHHENEIAQTEQLTGKRPFARYWLHNGWLQMNGEKMSKSLGNVLSIPEVVEEYGPDAYRMFVLSSHYTRPLSFSTEALESARNAAERLRSALRAEAGGGAESEPEGSRAAFEAAMDDDFNTPQALAVLFDLAREANRLRSEGGDASGHAALVHELTRVLGLRLESTSGDHRGDIGPFVDLLVAVRSDLRAARQWQLADRVREGLSQLGVTIEDGPEGTTWRTTG